MDGAEVFYRALPAFSRFADCARSKNYERAPDDWFVVVADIEGSTEAIGAGRYKAVNMVGAAVITSILNACPDYDLPYAFGGDGATLLIPPAVRPVVERSLLQTRAWAREAFGLSLRIGLVPLADIAHKGAEVRVAKYQMTPGNELAMFAGHGVELADRLVKQEGSRYRLGEESAAETPNLDGLSCRWAPLETTRGEMLTLLVHANPALADQEERAVYRSVMAEIGEILGGEAGGAPVTLTNLAYRWPPKGFWHEVKTAPRGKRFGKFLGVTLITLIAWWLNRTDKPLGGFDPALYRDQVHAQSDYQKFDDMLRMVVDCSAEEARAIESFLASERAAARLCYGLHRSERALMTCLVFSIEDNRHVHFIDGDGGGYALAAVQLKEQMAAL
jgi:hypothetical protein